MAEESNIEVGDITAEAAAFDKRISDRVAAGFVPDLRRLVKCDYFYKSFWRDPLFVQLYLGRIVDEYLSLLAKHCGPAQRILDVGCGAGYVALELARNGYHVLGIDVSDANIQIARRMLAENPFRDGFGSLRYERTPFHLATGRYDVILFSVSLHHMPDPEAVVRRASDLLEPGGTILCCEPCHERFGERDAAQVALMRALLAATGHWHAADEVLPHITDEKSFAAYVKDVQIEYAMERDKNEPQGQSPNDLEADGKTMLAALRKNFDELEYKTGFSFIYRLLGGIRGDEATVHRLARFLAVYDRLAVSQYGLEPNFFYFVGRRKN